MMLFFIVLNINYIKMELRQATRKQAKIKIGFSSTLSQ